MKQTNQSTGGTSFHDTVFIASVKELEYLFGDAAYSDNRGEDKVNYEWEMETESGDIFTVYDWKEGRRIKYTEAIEWHIGGRSKAVTDQALTEILSARVGSLK